MSFWFIIIIVANISVVTIISIIIYSTPLLWGPAGLGVPRRFGWGRSGLWVPETRTPCQKCLPERAPPLGGAFPVFVSACLYITIYYIHIYIYIYIYIYVCVYTYIYIYIYIRVYMYMYVYIYIYIYKGIQVYRYMRCTRHHQTTPTLWSGFLRRSCLAWSSTRAEASKPVRHVACFLISCLAVHNKHKQIQHQTHSKRT